MYGIEPKILDKLNPITLLLLEKIKVNRSTITNQSIINLVAYNALSSNNYLNSEELTKVSCLINFKKIIYVIGLIKRELEQDLSEFIRVSFVAKLVSLLFKINDMIVKYDIKLGDLAKIFDETDDALILAQFTKNKFVGVANIIDVLNSFIKKIVVNNSTELDINIRNSVNLDTFLRLKRIKYIIENYKEVVNPQTESDLFVILNNILSTATNFIVKMIDSIELIKFFETSDKVVQQLIIRQTNKNYINAIIDIDN